MQAEYVAVLYGYAYALSNIRHLGRLPGTWHRLDKVNECLAQLSKLSTYYILRTYVLDCDIHFI